MSWDTKALLVLTATWAGTAIIYVTSMDMPTGARAWGAGAALFLLITLGVWLAERKGRRRAHVSERASDAES